MNALKRVRLTAFALMIMTVLVLSGCGGNNANNTAPPADDSNGSGTEPAAANAANGTDAANAPAAADLPEYTIKMFVPGVPQKDIALINEEASKYLKDKINAKLEMTIVDWGSWPDKMNLKFASNEAFDINWAASWDNYFSRVEKGSYLPINDLIEKYGQDAKAILNPALLKGGLYDGKNYGLPVNKEIASQRGLLLNKALVEKYKIDISTIKTLTDLEPYLDIIKKNEPGITPYLMNKSVNPIDNTVAFGNEAELVLNMTDGGAAIDREAAGDELKVFNIYADPRYKESLELMRKWYQAGYINKDAATLQDFDGAIKAGQWFAFTDQLKPGKDAEKTNSHGVPMVQVELTQPIISTGDALGSMMSISATSKDPERAMMFLNLLYTDKYLVNLLSFGIEGKHYVKKSDNIISYPEGIDGTTSGYNPGTPFMFGNQFNDYLFDNENPEKWNEFERFNGEAVESKLLGFNFNIEPVKNEISAFQNAVKEFTPGLHTGTVDPEEVLPKFLEKMKSIGMDKVYAEVQKQLDEWKASK
ncbi:ABC transporter substrate-binding protein [Paenibacillus sepulcri]|uniref:ABC transporter substrate-binding protein n=1 Tax=Paenibacillus sepulcri TaxID=359917 RepID=A0ABS7BVF9_9BACL|nr:ABC transporter substrate-binding protein [Paenibacillus sepulcri]